MLSLAELIYIYESIPPDIMMLSVLAIMVAAWILEIIRAFSGDS